MYAVAASSERTVWVPPAPGRPHGEPQAEPCGVRHAVATIFSVPAAGQDLAPTALCGARLRGWRIYPGCLFDPSHAAACQRCAQLVTSLKMGEGLGGVRRRPVAAPRRLT